MNVKNILIGVVIITGMYCCFTLTASEPTFHDGEYMIILEGKNTIAQVIPVNAKLANDAILLSVDMEGTPVRTLKKDKNGIFNLTLDDPAGDFFIKAELKADNTLEGSFIFKASQDAKKRFFLNDSGIFKLIPYVKEEFGKVNKKFRKRLYDTQTYKSLKEMSKVSPLGRKLYQETKESGKATVYGYVIDQFGKPIEGVVVHAIKTETTIPFIAQRDYPIKAVTDNSGFWKFTNLSGRYIIIDHTEKKGYRRGKGYSSLLHISHLAKGKYDSKMPIKIVMIKRGKTKSYILKNDFKIRITKTKSTQYFSFFEYTKETLYTEFKEENERLWGEKYNDLRKRTNMLYEKDRADKKNITDQKKLAELKRKFEFAKNQLNKEYDELVKANESEEEKFTFQYFLEKKKLYDLNVNGFYDEKTNIWTVTITPNGKDCGILLSDVYLWNAPEKGYKKTLTFKWHGESYGSEDSCPLNGKFIFLKTHNPTLYTRIEIAALNCGNYMQEDGFYLDGTFFTNPFGSRILEMDEQFPAHDLKFEQTVSKELFNGKYPQKNDWDKKYAEYKKTHTWVKDLDGSNFWIRNSKLDNFKARIKHYIGKETVE